VLATSQSSEMLVEALAILNSFLLNCKETKVSVLNLIPNILKIIREHPNDIKIEDIIIRLLRNILLKHLIKVEDFLLEVMY